MGISVCFREVAFARGARKLLEVGLLLGPLGTLWGHGTRHARPWGWGHALHLGAWNRLAVRLGPPWREIQRLKTATPTRQAAGPIPPGPLTFPSTVQLGFFN